MPSDFPFGFAIVYIIITYATFRIWFQPEKTRILLLRYRNRLDLTRWNEFFVSSGLWLWVLRFGLSGILAIATWRAVVMIGEASLTPTNTPPLTSSPTLISSPTPISSPMTTATPMLPTPIFPASNGNQYFLGDFLFEPSSLPDCQLPCWQGLAVGSSDLEDVQAAFNRVFGFGGSLDFLSRNPLNSISGFERENLGLDRVPDLWAAGLGWSNEPMTGAIYAIAWFTRENILDALMFHWGTVEGATFDVVLSPQQVVRELGTPSLALASISVTGQGPQIALMTIYSDGLTFYFSSFAPVQITYTDESSGTVDKAIVEYCLGNIDRGFGSSASGSFYITQPFQDGLNRLSQFQASFIQETIDRKDLALVQEVLGITSPELVQLAREEGDACLYVDIAEKYR